jgi:hypothetical protein
MPDQVDEFRIGRRRDRRHQICVAGAYRTGSGTARAVELTDLSLTGCRFIDPSNRLAVGTRLTVKIGQVGPFDALVSWIDGSSIGLRFIDRLYAPYFEQLVERWPPGPRGLERRVNYRSER